MSENSTAVNIAVNIPAETQGEVTEMKGTADIVSFPSGETYFAPQAESSPQIVENFRSKKRRGKLHRYGAFFGVRLGL